MGWRIVDTDPQPDAQDWTRVKFESEFAAKAHARFLNEEEDRRAAKDADSGGATAGALGIPQLD